MPDESPVIDRRQFALGAGATFLTTGCTRKTPPLTARDFEKRLAAIEKAAGGRLGVHIWAYDVLGIGWRAQERFALCSTFKLPLAALAMREVEAGRAGLDEMLAYGRADLLSHSPETEKNVGEGRMTIKALCEAAVTYGDNCAANLLLRRFGGPAGLTRFWREMGDGETRLDRFEPDLNRVLPADVRDTTTPKAMARGIARMLLQTDSSLPRVLPVSAGRQLFDCMALSETGVRRIRAALPPHWEVGDKTGTASAKGMTTKINDVAVFRTPSGAHFVVAAYYETVGIARAVRPEDEAVLRRVGEVAVQWARKVMPE